jgi:predicted permease
VVGLLAAGIAANTALFAVVQTVLLSALPYPDAERLVALYESSPAKTQKTSLIAPARLEDWNRSSRAFTAIAGVYTENVTDTSGAEPERLSGRRTSPRYFEVYGVPAMIGRTPTAEEEREGGPLAAVISYGLWSRRYGQDPHIAGRRLVIGGQGYSIVGVMPQSFAPPAVDVWIPAQLRAFLVRLRDERFYNGVGRIRPGFTIAQAREDLVGVQRRLGEQFPATDKDWSVTVAGLKETRVADADGPLLMIWGALGLLLLIMVTNVASLVLAQLKGRERELAIRASMGATRTQVVGAVMREMTLLGGAGALVGWAAARVAMPVVARLFADVPRIGELHMDWRELAFAVAAGLAGVAAFGLLPAMRATGMKQAGVLLRAGRGVAGRQRVQRAMVAVQIALTMTLLAGAGVLVRSFYNLTHVDLGFDAEHAIMFHVGAAWSEDRARLGRMQERLVRELARIPGVTAAGITNFLPAEGATLRYQATLEGASATDDQGKMPIGVRTVSPGYLQALRVPLMAGAWCPELTAVTNGGPKAMVNRRFVEVYGRGAGVVGRHLLVLGTRPHEILGVVGDVREDAVNAPAYPYVYTCAVGGGWPDPDYVVRTAGDPRAVMAEVRRLVRSVDANRAVFGVQTIEQALGEDLTRPRGNARLLGLFAAAAMLLAAVGLYGLVAQMVGVRRREIGIRMALGAEAGAIVRSMLAGAGALIGAGVAGGIVLMALAARVLRSMVFGVSPLDAVSIGAAAVMLAGFSMAAAFIPARGAARVDPAESLRAE